MNNTTISSVYSVGILGEHTSELLTAAMCVYFIVCCCSVCICQCMRENFRVARVHSAVIVSPNTVNQQPVVDVVDSGMVDVVVDK